jgi:asparagine synthase (glutamine-hydrolysing)
VHASTPLPGDPAAFLDEDALRPRLRAELERAVRSRLPPAGEPVAVTLSGGIDSSAVAALARRLHEGRVLAWSVWFGPEHASELEFSALVAAHLGAEHRVLELPAATILHHLDGTVALLGKPNGDPLTVPNALLFRDAAAHAGVVLNGEGGDPCFGGPKNLPMLLSELFDGVAQAAPPDGRARAYLRAHLKCLDDLDELVRPELRASFSTAALEADVTAAFADPRWGAFVNKLMALNVRYKGGHHILPKVEQLSAPFGVLPRSPLFDPTVVARAFTVPAQLKLRGTVEKYLFKQAVADLLPARILERPKSGMMVPVEAWFTGPLREAARARLLDGLDRWGLFRRDYLERLLARRLPGLRPRHGVKLWLLLTLEAWLRQVVGS